MPVMRRLIGKINVLETDFAVPDLPVCGTLRTIRQATHNLRLGTKHLFQTLQSRASTLQKRNQPAQSHCGPSQEV